jgi:TRAP-type C4-dicarboxylate transport system permease large subunit
MEYIHIESPVLLLLFISGVMLLCGTFMDVLLAMAILGPLFLPLILQGIHPVHFGARQNHESK